jgi:hypothetical protein
MKTTTISLLLASCLLVALPACAPTMAQLDVTADAVHAAIVGDSFEGLLAISQRGMRQSARPEMLTKLSRSLARLGQFKERRFRSFHTSYNGPQEGSYLLVYERATLSFKIKTLEGKLVSFTIKQQS